MRYLTTIIAIFFSFALLNAQTFENDLKAKEIIEKLSKKTKSYSTIIADFSFKMDNQQEDISEEFDGKVLVKGDKYHLSIMGTETYSDGITIWTHMTDAEELNITNRDPEDDSFLNNPRKIFSITEDDYKLKYFGEITRDDIVLEKIELYPVKLDQGLQPGDEGASDLSKIIILVVKSDNSIKEVSYHGKDGNIYTVTLNSFVTNKPLEDSEFTFDFKKCPDVEVIDLRD